VLFSFPPRNVAGTVRGVYEVSFIAPAGSSRDFNNFPCIRFQGHRLATWFDGPVQKQIQFLPESERERCSTVVFAAAILEPTHTTFGCERRQREGFARIEALVLLSKWRCLRR
jgi:hypothetical protein